MFHKERKDINANLIKNVITNKSEAKTMIKHISCDCKWKLNSNATQNENGIEQLANLNVQIIVHTERLQLDSLYMYLWE